jgi:hypothetical protein
MVKKACNRSRTGDLLLTRQVLYQLSYTGLTISTNLKSLKRFICYLNTHSPLSSPSFSKCLTNIFQRGRVRSTLKYKPKTKMLRNVLNEQIWGQRLRLMSIIF